MLLSSKLAADFSYENHPTLLFLIVHKFFFSLPKIISLLDVALHLLVTSFVSESALTNVLHRESQS
ncbi:hypothetical protein Patl1_31180 [Pistacia atlantica]|uniref:Uncharacterized protein n=1 Tax=Pistacia atlantica TaxID=434234 RepID=A0ACC1A909_9ROSI|nr:hypothetical protein Patl1_31180 [Pistacia atlantica]